MTVSAHWHPMARSAELRAGDNIVAAWAAGRELALWRSVSGVVQAWDNRCPHRSVRLTLGHVAGERLVCGYHGWEWCAGSGACGSIPAHPASPPPDVAVPVHRVVERQGLVWVSLNRDGAGKAAADPAVDPDARGDDRRPLPGDLPHGPPADADIAEARFCRGLPLRMAFAAAEAGLLALGWARTEGGERGSFRGVLASNRAHALLLDAQPQLCVAWLWVDGQAPPSDVRQALLAARQLRQRLESP